MSLDDYVKQSAQNPSKAGCQVEIWFGDRLDCIYPPTIRLRTKRVPDRELELCAGDAEEIKRYEDAFYSDMP